MIIKQNSGPGKIYNGSRKRTRAVMRILGDNLDLTLELIDADNNAHAPEYCLSGQVEEFRKCVEEERNKPQPLVSPVSGRIIMERLGIQEGIEVGKVKRLMQEWYDENPELDTESLIQRYEEMVNNNTL
jgi:hypothetical protein